MKDNRDNQIHIDGVININKEKGFTSHDVVAKLRGILKIKKIGHTGTLDPDAQGVLPVCIGSATKLCDFIMEKDKEYRAKLVLGLQTDTQDTSGKRLNTSDHYKALSEAQIIDTIQSFVGEYEQLPPMYSAVKVNGKKLYELAREGIEVERKRRKVKIYSIDIESIRLPDIRLVVRCSRGTYIRTLCEDIGNRLNTYGCMGELLRTASGKFCLTDSIKISEAENLFKTDMQKFLKWIIPADEILSDFGRVQVGEPYTKLLLNGNKLTTDMLDGAEKPYGELVRIYDSQHRFIAVYRYIESEGSLKPEKMFV